MKFLTIFLTFTVPYLLDRDPQKIIAILWPDFMNYFRYQRAKINYFHKLKLKISNVHNARLNKNNFKLSAYRSITLETNFGSQCDSIVNR